MSTQSTKRDRPLRISGKSVLFLVNQDLGGGVEYLANVIGRDLSARGAHCTTKFIYPSSNLSPLTKLRHVVGHATAIARSAPDILITFQPTASAIASTAGIVGGCPIRIVHQSNSPRLSYACSTNFWEVSVHTP
jgi:hypothetical protein